MAELLDEGEIAKRAGEIGTAIMAARSLRLTDIAVEMEGDSEAGYKRIQRFLQQAAVLRSAFSNFLGLLQPHVRTFVRTSVKEH